MWGDYALRFANFAAWAAVMPENGGDLVFDDIGLVDGHTGYLVNLRLRPGHAVPANLQPFIIEPPLYPVRVWSGSDNRTLFKLKENENDHSQGN